MGDPHTLALSGKGEELMQLIDGGHASVSVLKQTGLFKGMTLLHCAASKGHAEYMQVGSEF